MVAIFFAESAGEIEAARALFVEYAESIDYECCFEGFEDELARLPHGYLKLLLAEEQGAIAGCAGLSALGGGACEMKRLYVRPEFRGRTLGRCLAEAVIGAAREAGCVAVTLETLPSMTAAHALYDDLGFIPSDPGAAKSSGAPAVMTLTL